MRRALTTTTVSIALFAFAVLPALAQAEGAPQWTVSSVARPTNFKPGDETGDDSYLVTVTNTGAASSDGAPLVVTDELPEGLTPDPAGAVGENPLAEHEPLSGFSCVFLSCTYTGVVIPDQTIHFTFPVDVAASPRPSCPVPAGAVSCVTNVVRVSGGGPADASMSTTTTISSAEASFGISPGGATTALSSTQAGAHPDLTTSIAFNTVNALGSLAGAPKDTTDDLPPGFAGDLVDTPSCPAAKFSLSECPVDTQVGITTLGLNSQGKGEILYLEPVYNLSPNPGEVAKIGFKALGFLGIQGNVSVRPGDYGLSTTFENVSESEAELDSVSLTIWGVPADPIHDPLRWNGGRPGQGGRFGAPISGIARVPFFTNPTACGTEPLAAEFSVTSWEHPNASESPAATRMALGPFVGCDRLGMEPELTAEATTSNASAPSGLALDMSIPQTYDDAEALATSTLKRAVVTLPEGMTVNPSAGAGLAACAPQQYAEEAIQAVEGSGCPKESKLGTVEIVSPALSEHATGSVYLAQPYENPFGSLLALYIVARIPNRGVLVKVAGEVQANPVTGRLVTTFDTANAEPHGGLPPLPFTLFTFRFNQGATSPLVTPPACGEYSVQAALTQYSEPTEAPIEPFIPAFPISSGFDGGACPSGGVPPFAPQVTAGTLNNAAGSPSPLYLRLIRNDGEQEITGFATQLPPGLTGDLSGVEQCSEAEIEAARHKTGAEEETEPSCPAGSEIGHSIAEAGVGSVLAQAPGKIYLSGPYEGAPFSVVAITSAHVGPFDLGTVVIHFPLDIDPVTAAVTIPAGRADQIPHIIKGIVIHVRDIRAYINRNDFMLNPTSCTPTSLSATVLGNGARNNSVTVSDPFQAADCQALKFEPKFQVSTSGKTSKADGASLHVNLTYPTDALGKDANIKQVKVELPKQLPSRLTTLQKACTAAQFSTNPAGCPAASNIGHAKANTPILPVPLEGPVYFVSHGGEAFPALKMVLQGDGVTIILTGNTFISKTGVTSSTFKAVPDQPVSSFELTLPEGPYSALAANGNFCALTKTVTVKKKITVTLHGHKRKVTRKVKQAKPLSLTMPTEFIAQNGATIHRSTPIDITNCSKAKPAKKVSKKKARAS